MGARVDGPVDFDAKKLWGWILMGNPDYPPSASDPQYVGPLDVGLDSALLSGRVGGLRTYWAMAKTATATYVVSITSEDTVNADVPDAYYSAAIAEMLKQMIANRPNV